MLKESKPNKPVAASASAGIILFFAIVLVSCAGKPEPVTISSINQNAGQQAPSQSYADTPGLLRPGFFQLIMAEESFRTLEGKRDDKDRRLVFQFCIIDSVQQSFLTLKGWPGKGNGKFRRWGATKSILNVWRPDEDNFIARPLLMSDQKLIKDMVGNILNQLDAPGKQFIIFDPEIDANNQVYYQLRVVITSNKDQSPFTQPSPITTNPSPPASSQDNEVGNATD